MDRFWTKVDQGAPDECWDWLGARCGRYGSFWLLGRQQGAHRVAYELSVGAIPHGLTIDHLCRNTLCVNPAHMEPVTSAENTRRAAPWLVSGALNRAKTECPHGHPYDEANTRIYRGRRFCRTCHNKSGVR